VAERWDGSSWSVQSPPYWTGQLGSVSCISDTSCTAVGYQVTGRITTAVAASWDGTGWTYRTLGGPQLLAVSCSAVNACTTVGDDPSLGTPVAERWDGSSWSVQSLPYWAGQLGSVSCASDTGCTAVGYQVTGRITTAVAASWSGS
jgi:hypothetical protein